MSVPAGTRFIGILPGVDMVERKSTQANSPTEVYTIEDIQGSNVPSNRTITINGTTQDLSANRTWTISTGLTVGTTPVTSGTDTRVFFQQGGVVQQDANFTFDNTLKRLTLKAVGTAATDIPLSIGNSAGTGLLFQATGDGKHSFNMSPNTNFALSIDQTNQNGGISVYSSGQTIFNVAKIAGSIGYMGVLNNGNYSFFTGNSSYFNHSLVVGGNSLSPGARLDVRAQGALSTDIAFRVRNSADTGNIFEVRGNSAAIFGGEVFIGFGAGSAGQGHLLNMRLGASTSVPFAYFDNNAYNLDIDRFCNIKLGYSLIAANSTHSLLLGLGTQPSSRNYQQTMASLTCISQGTNDSGFSQSGADTSGNNSLYYNYFGRNFVVGSTTQGTGSRKIVINSGTAPSTDLTDAFQLYSADIIAGNAAPHFRTENGNIVKIYQETTAVTSATVVHNAGGTAIKTLDTFDGYTLDQVVKALRNLGILA